MIRAKRKLRWSLRATFVCFTILSVFIAYSGHLARQSAAEKRFCLDHNIELCRAEYCGIGVLKPILGRFTPFHRVTEIRVTSNSILTKQDRIGERLPYLKWITLEELTCDEGFSSHLEGCRRLVELMAFRCEISSHLLKTIPREAPLASLGVHGATVEPRICETIADGRNLEYLEMSDCEVSRQSIERILERMKTLRHLDVRWSSLEWEDVNRLRRMYPNVQIRW